MTKVKTNERKIIIFEFFGSVFDLAWLPDSRKSSKVAFYMMYQYGFQNFISFAKMGLVDPKRNSRHRSNPREKFNANP